MRIIGIDPGSRICGWGVLEQTADARKLHHVDCGGIFSPAKMPLADRLDHIYQELRQLIQLHQPSEASVEAVFHAKNAKSALVLGHARAAAILACRHEQLSVFEYTPAEIKQAVCGYGRADKRQVALMVQSLLRLPETAMSDAADALAGAICHINSRKFKQAAARATQRKRP